MKGVPHNHSKLKFLVFLSQVIFGGTSITETTKYYSKLFPLESWTTTSLFPHTFSSLECASICSREHLKGNCCYHVRYVPDNQTCEIGVKAHFGDWSVSNNQGQIMSRVPTRSSHIRKEGLCRNMESSK